MNTAAGELRWCDLPTPTPAQGQVRVRVRCCGVCATDLEMIRGWDRTGFPAVPGHEWCGTVDAVGEGVDAQWVGQSVVAENVLSDGGEVGFEHAGGYAEFLVTEAANLRRLTGAAAGDPAAALVEPLAVCLRGLTRLRFVAGSDAVVFGDGPIGLITVMLLRRAGAGRVVLVGGRAARLALASELGAITINRHEVAGVESAVRRVLGAAAAARFLVEASGSPAALSAALTLAAPQARLLVLGDYAAARAEFAWNTLLHRELELIGSNASAGAWDEAVALVNRGGVPLARLVTHRLPAHRYEEAVALASTPGAAVKVLLDWRAAGLTAG